MHKMLFTTVLLFYLLYFCSAFDISKSDQKINIRLPEKEFNNFFEEENPISAKDEWKLRYFPEKSKVSSDKPQIFADRDTTSVDPNCDNSDKNVSVDWNGSNEAYTCFNAEFVVDNTIRPIFHSDFIPLAYVAPHVCIDFEIKYPNSITTFGSFRPIWAHFGEYTFIPKQRWLHNAEKGAVIMLYHPCANAHEVHRLRKLVTSCVFRHIITPYNFLPDERPLALVTWGRYLNMNTVNTKLVLEFIEEHALQGPENSSLQGKYDHLLIIPAEVVSDFNDSILCPKFV